MIKNKYFIAPLDEVKKIEKSEILDNVKMKVVQRKFEHIRQNLAGDKVVLKYPVDMKSEDMTLEDRYNVKYRLYNHAEILEIMITKEWYKPLEESKEK